MIRDIEIPEVRNVTIAIAKKVSSVETPEWQVFLINNNNFPIENTLVSSKGYGERNGEQQMTSTLRHFLETVPAASVALVEPIDPSVFHLTNEYWVSYYIGREIFDKRFVFVPDVITEENLIYIKELDMNGVLHS
jgi:hypothetical protein